MESKYAKHEKEILEMYSNGKAPAEIVRILNEKDPELEAEQNSLRVYIKRSCDKKNETEQTNDTKTVPEDQERAPEQETYPGKGTPAEKTISEKSVPDKTPEQKKADAWKRKAAAVKKWRK